MTEQGKAFQDKEFEGETVQVGALSPACRDVLHLLARGSAPAQIAARLRLPEAQVEQCLALLRARFGADDLQRLRLRILLMQGRE